MYFPAIKNRLLKIKRMQNVLKVLLTNQLQTFTTFSLVYSLTNLVLLILILF